MFNTVLTITDGPQMFEHEIVDIVLHDSDYRFQSDIEQMVCGIVPPSNSLGVWNRTFH